MRWPHVSFDLLQVPLRRLDAGKFVLDLEEGLSKTKSCQELEDAELHACHAADVHQRAITAQEFLVQLDLPIEVVMDVTAGRVVGLDLAADDRVVVEVRELLGQFAEALVVEQVGRVSHAHDEVDLALRGGAGTFEEFHDHAAIRRDAGTRCEKEIVVTIGLNRKDESLPVGAADVNLLPWTKVAEIVAAHSKEEATLIGIVPGDLRGVLRDQSFACRGENLAVATLSVGG